MSDDYLDQTAISKERFLCHGIVMVLAWQIFIPSAMLIARGLRSSLQAPTWFYAHISLVGIGSILFFCSWVYAVGEFGPLDYGDPHCNIAITIFAFWLLQILLGVFRPDHDGKTVRMGFVKPEWRSKWLIAHRGTAFVCATLGAANCVLGMKMFDAQYSSSNFGPTVIFGSTAYVLMGIFLALWFIVELKQWKETKEALLHDADADMKNGIELSDSTKFSKNRA